ncbi:sphingosine N-acyltransferase [Malassezia caprae]|uniref:Sphingosine N-acyltransferase n=1 Tax=Malassezia caprae TaxID=1381934 RepID=A0AAF0E973_9BASI|nr:sphingosine N-acyltransferase [Malassezia caprae]
MRESTAGITRRPNAPGPQRSSFFKEVIKLRWLVSPILALQLASLFVLGYLVFEYVLPVSINPFRPFLFLSYRLPESQVLARIAQNRLYGPAPTYSADNAVATAIRSFFQQVHATLFPNEPKLIRFGKGVLDVCFMAYYVIVFSFLRQTITESIFKPLAARWGIKSPNKQTRFAEQGYALTYWGSTSIVGLYVMSFQDSWWYNLEHLWYQYPHWQMRPELKLYYLLQASYWLQQAFVMLLGLERPRKDYYELVAHHLVTLWLIGWSYFINLTMIGTTVFVCMDIPDTWLAVFAPLFLLLLLNIFWYVIMWRVLYRAIYGVYGDTREDGEEDEPVKQE